MSRSNIEFLRNDQSKTKQDNSKGLIYFRVKNHFSQAEETKVAAMQKLEDEERDDDDDDDDDELPLFSLF